MLYIVGTPIGNLEDITQRALRVLSGVDFILAEDTRVIRKLLNHFDISTPTISFHEHSKEKAYLKVLDLLEEGKELALVTDAGMPAISDPGSKLVARVVHDLPEIKIESVPGPSSVTTALSISGISATKFFFAGFAPNKKGRQTFFKEIPVVLSNLKSKRKDLVAFIFFESPHRVIKALQSLEEFCPQENVVIAKEITKIHEEVISGKPSEILEFFSKHPDKIKGEFVVIVY